MLAIPPFWASSKNALLRANTKPPVELVVADLVYLLYNRDILRKKVFSMAFNENAYQQMSFTDSFSGLTVREQKAQEKS